MINFFQYSFMIRGLEAGIILALVAPLIGIFLVLRRYALMADTLAHVSLAGIAAGLILRLNPLITALISSVAASVLVEKLRTSKKLSSESALAMFLSGGLALAVVLISLTRGSSATVLKYLFGSIATVSSSDVWLMAGLGLVVAGTIWFFYREFVFVSFDEEAAQVSGISVHHMNTLLVILAAVTVSLAIPVVGVLLISALMVIPVVTALQLRLSFGRTMFWSEVISLFCVVAGILLSFYFDLAAGGVIVLLMIGVFLLTTVMKSLQRNIL